MNGEEHIKMALKTESVDWDVLKDGMDGQACRFVHVAMGISTEVAELAKAFTRFDIDWVNVGEEIGDAAWYLSVGVDVLRELGEEEISWEEYLLPYPNLQTNLLTIRQILDSLVILSGDILDIAKKRYAYSILADTDRVCELFEGVAWSLNLLLREVNDHVPGGLTWGQVFERNIAKLDERYGGKFSKEAAENRDLDAERKVLEGSDE